MLSKIVQFVKDNSKNIVLTLIIFLISLFSFAGGYLTARYQENGEDIQILAPVQSKIITPATE